MDINRFTEKVQQALSAAQPKAVRYGHQQIDVEHLLAIDQGGAEPVAIARLLLLEPVRGAQASPRLD